MYRSVQQEFSRPGTKFLESVLKGK